MTRENEVEAGDFEAYDPLGLNWEVGGDDLPEPVHVVEDFDGKPSWDPAQPPSAFTCFVMLFPIVLFASVVAETNRYGKWIERTALRQGRRPKVWVDTDVDELCRFFGLIIVHTLHTWFFFCTHFFSAPKLVFMIAHILFTFQAMSTCRLNNQRQYWQRWRWAGPQFPWFGTKTLEPRWSVISATCPCVRLVLRAATVSRSSTRLCSFQRASASEERAAPLQLAAGAARAGAEAASETATLTNREIHTLHFGHLLAHNIVPPSRDRYKLIHMDPSGHCIFPN